MPVIDELSGFILTKFPHQPTAEQSAVVGQWCEFLMSPDSEEIFLLQGYAGTGKTSLVGALVRALTALKRSVVLLAPTGRAAKVFSLHADHAAYTIHKKIYRQKSFSVEMINFQSNINSHRDTLFIVDEASMISNEGLSARVFGTGRLLDDLVHFVYAGEGCRLMLVGDSAQLPPVGEQLSPALNPQVLSGYGLRVRQAALTQVLRQVDDSGILWNATMLRQLISSDEMASFPRFRISSFPDVRVVNGEDLVEVLEDSYYRCGEDQTIVITRSNKRAILYNNGIRARILQYEDQVTSGDQLIVVKNNYYWKAPLPAPPVGGRACIPPYNSQEDERLSPPGERGEGLSFIANGDVCVVRRLRNVRSLYGFSFADATLRFPDFDDMEMDATLLLNTLWSEAPALTQEQQTQLFTSICKDYPEIREHRKLMEKIKEDPYFNALQVKYAYAVTCHKAQGGQWQRVFIDQGYVTTDMLTSDYFRWLYTALTRATETVYLVNWPPQQILE